ncbi:hypothetical protein B0H13DRAFT_2662792 [Mycena leptocephala]|nr:hypothetical protein B0H13DRAFT_2666418 [Mycena leptocephala]KAJ7906375.1 hypothetical protein B0H13DRAFT_2662792 [Mycena leptocephala]
MTNGTSASAPAAEKTKTGTASDSAQAAPMKKNLKSSVITLKAFPPTVINGKKPEVKTVETFSKRHTGQEDNRSRLWEDASVPPVCGPQNVLKTPRYYPRFISPRSEAFWPVTNSPTPKYRPHQQGRVSSVTVLGHIYCTGITSNRVVDGPADPMVCHAARRWCKPLSSFEESAEATRCNSSMVYSAVPSSDSASSAPLATLSIVDRAPPLPPRLTYEDDRRLPPCTHHLAPPSPSLAQTLRLPSKPPHFPSSTIEFSLDPRVSHLRLTSMGSAGIGGWLAARRVLSRPFDVCSYRGDPFNSSLRHSVPVTPLSIQHANSLQY